MNGNATSYPNQRSFPNHPGGQPSQPSVLEGLLMDTKSSVMNSPRPPYSNYPTNMPNR